LTTVKKPPIETASWCYRDKEEDVHHDFAWTITSFSRKINEVASGECIESDKFVVSAHGTELEWQLCIYPGGRDKEDEGYVSILLELLSRSLTATFSGKIEFCVFSANRDKIFRKQKIILESDTQICRPMFGLLANKFIKHDLLRLDQQSQSRQIIPEDKLTVMCEITIEGKDVQHSSLTKLQSRPTSTSKIFPEKFNSDFNFLLESGQLTDVTIKCQGRELNCHKVILAARSPLFNALFIQQTMDSHQNEIKIEDLDIDTLQEMLKYIYAGTIDKLSTRSGRLLEAAEKYQLPELKRICEEELCETLTVDSCLDCLVLAHLYNAPDLKEAAVKFVVSRSAEFVDQIDKFTAYPELLALLFRALARSPIAAKRSDGGCNQ